MKGGVAIISMNHIRGDIVWRPACERYAVALRGVKREAVIVHESDLVELSSTCKIHEEIRHALYARAKKCARANKKDSAARHLRLRVLATELSDEVDYLITSNTKVGTVDPLPKYIQETVLVREIEACFFNEGETMKHFGTLTSYAKACLEPFVKHQDLPHGVSQATSAMTGSMNDSMEKFQTFIRKDASNAAAILLRAFAYGEWRLDIKSQNNKVHAKDSLLDAFIVSFAATQVLQGNVQPLSQFQNEIKASLKSCFDQHGIDLKSRLSEHGIDTAASPGMRISQDHLAWCFCIQLLKIGRVVRDSFTDASSFERILPNPYSNTSAELLKIVQLAIWKRPENPVSFLQGIKTIRDLKDFILYSTPNEWLENEYKLVRAGKQVAERHGDPLHRYTFQLMEIFWRPTQFWPEDDNITYPEAKELVKQATTLREECSDYLSDLAFEYGEVHEKEFKAYAKAMQGGSKNAPIPRCPNAHVYCSAQFRREGQRDRYDRIRTKYVCANCSKRLDRRSLCERCKKVAYCGPLCQKQHWKKVHKAICKPVEDK
jgi:hypothetical protein